MQYKSAVIAFLVFAFALPLLHSPDANAADKKSMQAAKQECQTKRKHLQEKRNSYNRECLQACKPLKKKDAGKYSDCFTKCDRKYNEDTKFIEKHYNCKL